MKLKFWFIVAIGVMLSAVAACTTQLAPQTVTVVETVITEKIVTVEVPAEAGQPRPGGTLRVAVPEILHLDVDSVNQIGINEIAQSFYETLFDRDANGEVVPLLVKEVEISDDGTVHTWTLQENVKFHDGSEFNADVVKWNLDHKIETKGPLYDFIPFESIEVVDPLTVRVTLTRPYLPMYNLLAIKAFSMYHPDFVEQVGPDGLKNQANGTGPFMVEEYVPNERLTLTKNPEYWQEGLPYLDQIVYQVSRDNNTRAAMLEAGDVDVAAFLSIQDIDRFKVSDEIEIYAGSSTRHYYMSLNNTNPPLDDVRVRQAINYAIDKEGIARTVFLGYAKPAEAVIVNDEVDGFTSPGAYPYDPERANALLDEAGWTDTNDNGTRDKDGEELSLLLRTRKDAVPGDIATVELVQGMLSEVGIEIEVEIVDTASFLAQLNQPVENIPYYDIVNLTWGTFTGDAEYVLRTYYRCDAWPPVYYNYSLYCNEEVDRLIDQANMAPSREERDEIYAEVIKLVRDDAPTILLLDGLSTVAVRNTVKGIYLDPAQTIWPVKYVWLEQSPS
jgi:ABC-type transport system substrate-binding protein